MGNSVDQERLNIYQTRVSDWIGEQGIFFQLRYAGIVGNHGISKQIGSLLVKLLIIMAAMIGIGYLILNHHFSSNSYRDKLSERISSVLKAEDIEVSGFSRARGQGVFREVEITGSEESFFMEAELKVLSGPIDSLAGISHSWSPEQIAVSQASFQLKAGGENGEMEKAFQAIIQTFEGEGVKLVTINNLDLDWGYSKLTYGAVTGTSFQASLENGVWQVTVKGGKFTQNWLKDLDLISGELIVSKEGIQLESLKLALGTGVLEMAGVVKGTLDLPEFNIKGDFTNLPIEKLVELSGMNIRNYISGAISGSIQLKGSTNRRITTNGIVELNEGDMVTIRDKWEILKAMSLLDINSSYRRIDFNSGGFSFETSGGGMKIDDISLRAGDLLQLKGKLVARLPNQKQAAEALDIVLTNGFKSAATNDVTDTSGAQSLEDERMSLKRVTGGGKVNDFELSVGDTKNSSFVKEERAMSANELDEQRIRLEMNIHRFEGDMQFGVASTSFDEYPSLQQLYPTDSNGWRWVDLNVATTFSQISAVESGRLLDDSRIRIRKSREQ